jgi:hypothetical protein
VREREGEREREVNISGKTSKPKIEANNKLLLLKRQTNRINYMASGRLVSGLLLLLKAA